MSGKNREYNQKFKDDAAKYCIEKAKSITQGAKDLNIMEIILYKNSADK